jgi:chemosensory pili system protein ChpA (sensor histidine kinase/response regulator)
MGEKRNYAALEWVVGEIGETLKEARQALEAFVEDPRDVSRIRFCLTHIHQVLGSLQMIEFHGGALIAEEMELLAQALLHNNVTSASEAQEVLMRSLLQLPIYLEHAQRFQDDHPGIALPLLNDMRAARKHAFLSESGLFTPELAPSQRLEGDRHAILGDRGKLVQALHKLREMYQYAAASALKDIKLAESLEYIDKVFSRMEIMSRGTRTFALWQAAAGMVEHLRSDEIELSVAVRNLLRRLARELKTLEENAPAAFDAPPNEGLLRNLLYYVARAERFGPRTQVLRQKYQLDKALNDGAVTGRHFHKTMISAPDPEAIRTVVAALQDELNTVKHILGMALSGQAGQSDIEGILPLIKRVSDTLALLGIPELRKFAQDQCDQLTHLCKSGDWDQDVFAAVAGRIVEIEHRLEAISKGAGRSRDLSNVDGRQIEIDNAKETVLRESRAGLEQCKDAIVEFYASKWDRNHLSATPEVLSNIRGGLNMVGHTRAAAVVDACRNFLMEQFLNPEYIPDGASLTALANAIEGVDYFLERVSSQNADEETLRFLALAEESLRLLNYPAKGREQPEPVSAPPVAPKPSLRLAEPQTAPAAPAPVSPASFEPEATDEASLAPAPLITPEPNLDAAEDAAQAEAETDAAAEDENLIDDEIIEIFIEEAGEVLETLAEQFPVWASNLADLDSLTVVRRAFHTLKGSGRMVEARDVGELAWAVENMLNRVLDNSIQAEQLHLNYIEQVLAFMPQLIKAFEERRRNPDVGITQQLIGVGQALARGEMPLPDIAEGDSELENDDEQRVLWELFASEASTHLAAVDAFIQQMHTLAPLYTPPSDALQRALHTLKGSAHMANVTAVAQIATPLEGLVKELRLYQVSLNDDLLALLTDGARYTQGAVSAIRAGQPVAIPHAEQFVARVEELKERDLGHLIGMKEPLLGDGHKQVDPRLLSLFMAEEMRLLLDADQILLRWCHEGDNAAIRPLIDELNRLEAGAQQANLPEMAKLSAELCHVHELCLASDLQPDASLLNVLIPAHEHLLDMVDSVAAGQNLPEVRDSLQTALTNTLARLSDRLSPAPLHLELPLEAVEPDTGIAILEAEPIIPLLDEPALLQDAPLVLEDDTPDGPAEYTLEHTTEPFEQEVALGDMNLGDEPEHPQYLETSDAEDTLSPAMPGFSALDEEPSELHEEEHLTLDEGLFADDEDSFALDDRYLLQAEGPSANTEPSATKEPASENEADSEEPSAEDEVDYEEPLELDPEVLALDEASPVPATEPAARYAQDEDDDEARTEDDYDPEILEIFLEEADELMEELDEAIHAWQGDWNNSQAADVMKRALHTLKGGARLASQQQLGELTHDYESYLIAVGGPEGAAGFFAQVHAYQDKLLKSIKRSRRLLDGGAGAPVAADGPLDDADLLELDSLDTRPNSSRDLIPAEPQAPALSGSEPRALVETFANPIMASLQEFNAQRKAGSQEVIKVSADLLEELVNLAGETSISRGRLEQQIKGFGSAIHEIDGTLRRLQEQLRRLDIETEAQILFRQEQLAEHEAFDPLEMDRYSQLQQLSRSLMESASDLVDLKRTLSEKVKDTEAILLQQSRINSSLQEGLMRSRMVPFSRLVPRLRRIVRQVAGELGKQVSFELDNVEGEMDRSVLERMVAPLEHMLRNAVDHGIEPPADRLAKGKPEFGRILLSLAREGGDILLRLADDGRGISLDKVRKKAVERGLMAEDSVLSDHEVMQFILQAGFSTAENVTQISGRGVGMDVVAAEIKQLGGSMTIESKSGVGSQFTVRLPFTVSVNRALMVTLGNDTFAIPLNAIEGIVRVSPFELEHYYQQPDASFEYADENYQVRYLGGMLYEGMSPKLEGQLLPLPVILVRSAQHTMALQVDTLMGSREIVVKSLGKQFAAVQGLSGATVMGDGSVVIILDVHALVRKTVAFAQALPLTYDKTKAINTLRIQKTIMVVDDSVTVRKVTSRFLEREGYLVITAKDGVDALKVLQDQVPDLMLLDIEMPRMDGFEVAKNVRTTARWKHLPIVMITSRTGDKHRDHALSIGVNEYLGKPYQEDVLAGIISRILGDKSA